MKPKQIKQLLEDTTFFDKVFYLRTYHDARLADATPIDHFIKVGLDENRKPNQDFDPNWYLENYPDVREKGTNPVLHFLLYGKKEERLQNDKEKTQYELLNDESVFDISFYKNNYQDLSALDKNFNYILHYIRYGQYEGRIYNLKAQRAEGVLQPVAPDPQPEIRNDISNNNDGIEDKCKSLLQSVTSVLTPEEKELYDYLLNEKIDWSKYFDINNHDFVSEDPVYDYVQSWKKHQVVIPDFFDAEFYLENYPDIKSGDINPLIHFMEHGKGEGRQGVFDQRCIKKGELEFNSNNNTIVFVSHESSATGAPLLGYNIVGGLKDYFNIIHIVIKKSNISDIIKNNCFLYVEDISLNPEIESLSILNFLNEKYGVKAVVLNSVETFPVLHISTQLKLPTVSLIHEFSEYTRPIGKMINTLFHATEIIIPAAIINNSMLEELKNLTGIDTRVNHISQLPQGKLPFLPDTYGDEDTKYDLYKKLNIDNPSETKIIVGSGYVQVRKGVDLFLSTARYIKQKYSGPCKFVWVGDGYNPEHDFACSVWLKRDIKFYGLEDDFVFLEHQKSLDTVFSLADVFCLTSRMDPFPNVAIDAMEKDLPIACFKDASGTEEFLKINKADYLIAEYLDTYDLATQIVEYFLIKSKKKTINSKIVANELAFDDYIKSITMLIEKAQRTNQQTLESTAKIINANIFDSDYYGLVDDIELATYYYVSLYKKGLHKMSPNPKPGFSQLQWVLEHGENEQTTPLEQAIDQSQDQTHTCLITPLEKSKIQVIEYKYAVHLHLYYTDLASNFKEYFKNLVGSFDLYITIIKSEDTDFVYQAFEGCGAKHIEVVVVKNIGRDVGPMLFDLNKQLTTKGYEVIGHFHSKKSLSTDGELGDRWREYLMQNLCGGNGIAESILTQFNDPKVGLVFAEDKHIVDIGINQPYISELCEQLILPTIKDTHVFPLGNMFWARVEAIKQFFELDSNKILQPEPLPYDGSYMHAIERITPNLVIENGFKFITVYKKGTKW